MCRDLDLLRLSLVRGMNPRAATALLEAFDSAGEALRAPPGAARRVDGVGKAAARGLLEPPSEREAAAVLRAANRRGIEFLCRGGEGYPARLLELADPPVVLWALGRTAPDDDAVAVVGARRASVYGRGQAERFGAGLARAGISVVSGLARGVDGAAHRGAIAAEGRTVAILGCGLDRIYPPEHRTLAKEIAADGLLLSEFPPGTPPLAHHFPMRNRLIAGLARGVVVVEGGVRSGSLITARLAGENGREVFAVPGRVDSELARGPHALIRDGAILVAGPDDVLTGLGYVDLTEIPELPLPEDALQRRVLEVLTESSATGVEQLLETLEVGAPALLAALLALELAGWARALPGRRYVRAPGTTRPGEPAPTQ